MLLRPLTVFVGPSDTGKSYLSILIYALHQVLGGSSFHGYATIRRELAWTPHIRPSDLPAKLRGPVLEWLRRLHRDEKRAKLPSQMSDHFRVWLEQEAGLDAAITVELERCFGLESLDDLIRVGSTAGRACFELGVPSHGAGSPARYGCSLESSHIQVSCRIPELKPITARLHKYLSLRVLNDDVSDDWRLLQVWIRTFRAIHHSLVEGIPQAYYLPADRAGVMHSHQALVGTLIRDAASAGLHHAPNVPLLTGVFADFLSNLVEMTGATKRRSYGAKKACQLASRIEEDILNGEVRRDRSNPFYPSFTFQPKGWSKKLPLKRASSTVSELAPIALFLRHTVRPGDLLIIEEPEAHLHPAKQADLTVALARLVRAGFRLLVTTHSDWVLEALGNLVRLSELPAEARSKFADADCALTPEQVGVWLFDRTDEATSVKVRELALDRDTGLFPADWDDVQETLYNTGAQIHNQMQDLRQG